MHHHCVASKLFDGPVRFTADLRFVIMATESSADGSIGAGIPRASTQSFPRLEDPATTPSQDTTKVLQQAEMGSHSVAPESESLEENADVFEKRDSADSRRGSDFQQPDSSPTSQHFPDQFDELPIELISLTDR